MKRGIIEELSEARTELERLAYIVPTVEELFTSPEYFGVATATPLQRAICRIADGRPLGELAHHPHVVAALSSWSDPTAKLDPDSMPSTIPRFLYLVCGTRSGKTRLSAANAVRRALTCDVSHLATGDFPRVPIVSLKQDLAGAAFEQLKWTCLSRPKLRALMIGKPTADTVTLRHPSGTPVEILVVAGAATGASLVSRWLAGVIFDEAPRMMGSADGAVVNLNDMLTAIMTRLLDGAQVALPGSPFAPMGPVYDAVQQYHGRPGDGTVVVRAKGWWMNPAWWTPKRRDELARSKKTEDRMALRTDGEAEFTDPEEALFPKLLLDRARRQAPTLGHEPGHEYCAAMDPATRSNAWTLAIGTRLRSKKLSVVFAKQWVPEPGRPLRPKAVLGEMSAILRDYGLGAVETDQYMTDALRDLAGEFGVSLIERPWTSERKWDLFRTFGDRLADDGIELPPDPQVAADLLMVRKRTTQQGIQIILPKTSDGRHCDFAPSCIMCLSGYLDEPPPLPAADPRTRLEQEAQRLEQEAVEELEREQRQRPRWYRP